MPATHLDWFMNYQSKLPLPNWALLAMSLVVLYLGVRKYGLQIIEAVISWLLSTFNTGTLSKGKQISGPKWQYPNGTVIERFINGRANSEKWRKYGPVYRVWNGTHPEIVITTPEDLKHFSSDANDHPKNHNMNLGWFVGELLGQAMGLLYGPDWKRLRKIFDPAFTHSAAVSRINVVDEAARKYVEELPLQAKEAENNLGLTHSTTCDASSFTLPVLRTFTKFPYFLTARAIYGPMTEEEENDLWSITQKRVSLNQYWVGGGPYRFETTTRLYDAPAFQRLREFNKEWREYNAHLVEDRRLKGESVPVVAYWEEFEKGNMAMVELLQTLDELLMLNLDVITHVLTWFITLVAEHEQVKQELREEVAANKDNLLEYLTKTDSHLHRCFIESMRVRPFAIFTIGEASAVVKNFHGVLVKPNTQILVDVLAINVRNPFWGPNSESFDPSRLMSIKQADLRYNLHSFGIGSRKCMGQYVAGHILKSLVVHLFDTYEVSLLEGNQPRTGHETNKNSWTPKAEGSLLLTKRDGCLH
ncbi:cytochrome P450 monooxygenase GliC2 [Cryphonectria parasitica EP155]|uniref:Cytochrome P450 monooxygenase GliC2 n=1 Tax=Cryphonectria parasitica (strain ATCC 38755 / EP155) TaxID=660469 RepID=A0A9P5CQW6_CRYP1|nr:cytochrome P450 monooxygenase GliC2 [Cryphonectria parasitica EP155]KAF3766641.1 cytochrome P450 monooxygenase GliC2 [Cryphonectria parasitica EP155]